MDVPHLEQLGQQRSLFSLMQNPSRASSLGTSTNGQQITQEEQGPASPAHAAPTWLVSCHGAAAHSSALVPGRFKSRIPDAQSTKICSLQGRVVSRPWEDPLQVTAVMGRGKAEAKWFRGPQGLSDPCYASLGIDCSSVAANVLGGS